MNIDPVTNLEEAAQAANIESIKEMMDGFDPAALLPDLSTVFGRVELICRIAVVIGPVILLLMGLSYLFLSPKEANHYFGYKCYFGMGSVQAWRFTQRFAGIVLGSLGLILTVAMTIVSFGFPGMEIPQMVWRAVVCLFWQAILSLIALETVNLTAMYLFDRKGVLRKQKKEEKRSGAAEPETAEEAEAYREEYSEEAYAQEGYGEEEYSQESYPEGEYAEEAYSQEEYPQTGEPQEEVPQAEYGGDYAADLQEQAPEGIPAGQEEPDPSYPQDSEETYPQ